VVGEFAPGDETWYMLGLDLIAQDSSATGWSYPLTDGLGSVRAVMGSGNSVLHATNYDPYGNPLAVGGLTQSAFGFTGQQTDDTGLQYLRARYYSPALGAFLTTDPVLGVSGSPVSTFNPYSYVRGNTVNLTDPSGMIAPLRLIARAAILSGAISAAMEAANQLSQNGNDWDCLDLNKIGMAGLQGAVLGGLSAAFGLLPQARPPALARLSSVKPSTFSQGRCGTCMSTACPNLRPC
jgi:RHS repeat-associated protein